MNFYKVKHTLYKSLKLNILCLKKVNITYIIGWVALGNLVVMVERITAFQ